jgi:hypothetical protein
MAVAGWAAPEISIDFTTEELLVLVGLLGLDLFSLDTVTLSGVDQAGVLTHARHALVARRVVSGGDEPDVSPAVARMLGIMAAPLVVVEVARRTRDRTTHSFFAAIPEATISQRFVSDGIHRFTPFPTNDLLARALEDAELQERPAPPGSAFKVEGLALRQALTLTESGERAGNSQALEGAGVPAADASAFTAALAERTASVSVSVVHRPGATTLQGGEIAWIDCGDYGLWGVPSAGELAAAGDEDGSYELSVYPTSAVAIGAAVHSFLPPAQASPSHPGGAPEEVSLNPA